MSNPLLYRGDLIRLKSHDPDFEFNHEIALVTRVIGRTPECDHHCNCSEIGPHLHLIVGGRERKWKIAGWWRWDHV